MGGRFGAKALALLPLQTFQLATQPPHLTTQGIIFGQQRLDIAGDPLFSMGARPMTRIKTQNVSPVSPWQRLTIGMPEAAAVGHGQSIDPSQQTLHR